MEPTEWSFEQKAECFRKEIHERFVAENKYWREEETLGIELVKKKDPTFYATYPNHLEINDSLLWELYQKSDLEITQSEGVRVTFPDDNYAIVITTIEMFENTEVAWSLVSISAKIIDGIARLVLSICLVDYWDDDRSFKWREDRRCKDIYLLRKLRTVL